MRRRSVQLLALCCILLSWGCVSFKHSPGARFFVLSAVAEPPAAESAPADPDLVGVMPAALPDHLLRSQMVTWTSDNEVHLEEYTRWAEPLDAGVTRVVRENLAILLPQHRFVAHPWRKSKAVRCRVQVEVHRFGSHPDGTVRLDVAWALLPPDSDEPLHAAPVVLRSEPVEKSDPDARVEAMSALLAQLCEGIASGIRSLPDPKPDPESVSQP
jgi:uncharacterized lipoprotein YmbA